MKELNLEKLLSECHKHIKRLRSASKKMSLYMPLSVNRYENLTDDEVEHIDQFLFRFAKLQDTIGNKLFGALLSFLQEANLKNSPFLDVLNRLEQLKIIENKDDWVELRKIRNDISHHYDDDSQEMVLGINAIYQKKDLLIEIFNKVESQYNETKSNIV
jgi:hypothetical protein